MEELIIRAYRSNFQIFSLGRTENFYLKSTFLLSFSSFWFFHNVLKIEQLLILPETWHGFRKQGLSMEQTRVTREGRWTRQQVVQERVIREVKGRGPPYQEGRGWPCCQMTRKFRITIGPSDIYMKTEKTVNVAF